MPDFEHLENKEGDINVLVTIDQLFRIPIPDVILHLDGNRWYERHGKLNE